MQRCEQAENNTSILLPIFNFCFVSKAFLLL